MQGYFEPASAINRVAGEKGGALLHGQLSNHIQELKSGEGNYNLLLTNKGKVEADLYVYRSGNDYLLIIDKSFEEKVIHHLKKFAPLSRVEIGDETSKYFLVHIIDHPSDKSPLAPLLQRGGLTVFPFGDSKAPPFVKGGMGGILPAAFRADRLGLSGYDVLVPTEKKKDILAWLKKMKLSEITPEVQEILRVENGICKVGVDATGENLPQEARLDRALHFGKGCYLGQETIARLHFLGHVNKILAGLKIESNQPIEKGTVIFEGEKEVGKITSCIHSPQLNSPLALGYIPYQSNQPDNRFVLGNGGPQAVVVDLPLPKPVNRPAA